MLSQFISIVFSVLIEIPNDLIEFQPNKFIDCLNAFGLFHTELLLFRWLLGLKLDFHPWIELKNFKQEPLVFIELPFVPRKSDKVPKFITLWKDQFPELFLLNLALAAGIDNKNALGEMDDVCQLWECLGFDFFEHLELALRDKRELAAYGLG